VKKVKDSVGKRENISTLKLNSFQLPSRRGGSGTATEC